MVVVQWSDEPYSVYVGKTQSILARTIAEPPLDQLQRGCEVRVKMGRSSAARAWKAQLRGTAEELEQSMCAEASAELQKNVSGRKRTAAKKTGGKEKNKLQGEKKEGAASKPKVRGQ